MSLLNKELRQAIIGWDFKSWNRALNHWDRTLDSRSIPLGPALEIGARSGGLSLYLALRDREVYCTDLVQPTLEATAHHAHFKVRNRIVYRAADATQLPFDSAMFAIVAFKSVLGSIGRDGDIASVEQVVNEVSRVLKPNGVVLFAENCFASRLHMALRRRFNRWGSYYYYFRPEELRRLLSSLGLAQFESFGFLTPFGRTEAQRAALHAIDVPLTKLIPTSNHYLIYGHAMKH